VYTSQPLLLGDDAVAKEKKEQTGSGIGVVFSYFN